MNSPFIYRPTPSSLSKHLPNTLKINQDMLIYVFGISSVQSNSNSCVRFLQVPFEQIIGGNWITLATCLLFASYVMDEF